MPTEAVTKIQTAKRVVVEHTKAFDIASDANVIDIMHRSMDEDIYWRGMYPFYELSGLQTLLDAFWLPFRKSLSGLQRREDVFLAGLNDVDNGETVWTCSMGHFMGLFDTDWLKIPKTGRLANLRYTEFMRVDGDRIVESALFFDLIGFMQQAGVYPLPPMLGSYFIYPGPRTHDGLLYDLQNPKASEKTLSLINAMIADLNTLNPLEGQSCPPEFLARTWHDNMLWYGPCGIGATYTIERYQAQHQNPFRMSLTDKTYNGHVARFADGDYGAFFGWANLSNRNTGGFIGLTEAASSADMRVVDVYRRCGDKLAENWVIIDLPHYLKQQGLDILARLEELLPR